MSNVGKLGAGAAGIAVLISVVPRIFDPGIATRTVKRNLSVIRSADEIVDIRHGIWETPKEKD